MVGMRPPIFVRELSDEEQAIVSSAKPLLAMVRSADTETPSRVSWSGLDSRPQWSGSTWHKYSSGAGRGAAQVANYWHWLLLRTRVNRPRARSRHAATPPRSVMNSRRFMCPRKDQALYNSRNIAALNRTASGKQQTTDPGC